MLRYHRPMLEDCQIAYEFYHEPGKVMVHPAIDRLGFVLEPEGVKIHWLTDAAPTSGPALTPENLRATSRRTARGPSSAAATKPKAWNRVVLSLAGDRVALKLNDQSIYERALEPTNQRLVRPVPLFRRDPGSRCSERELTRANAPPYRRTDDPQRIILSTPGRWPAGLVYPLQRVVA